MFHEAGRSRHAPLLVALALAVVVVGVGAVVSLVQSGKRPPAPAAVPGASGVTVLEAPPTGRPLLWFRDDSTTLPFVLRATDWSGRVLGRLALSCGTCGVLPSPDGQRLLIGDQLTADAALGMDRVFSSTGRLISSVDGYEAQWADDGRHLCTTRARGGVEDLRVIDTNTGRSRVAASFPVAQLAGPNGAAALLGCDVSADRALIAFTSGGLRALMAVRLSTGVPLYTHLEPPVGGRCACDITTVAVSGDGTLGVENLASGAVRPIDVATGGELPVTRSWYGRGPVIGLSWNGALAVTPIGVYTFPAGQTLWQAPLPAYMLPVASRPASDDVLLSVWESSSVNGRPIVVHLDGSAVHLSSSDFLEPPPS